MWETGRTHGCAPTLVRYIPNRSDGDGLDDLPIAPTFHNGDLQIPNRVCTKHGCTCVRPYIITTLTLKISMAKSIYDYIQFVLNNWKTSTLGLFTFSGYLL
ncbi:hypothetical protein [Xanthocytophaga agilis]|uniref:Uncharacterized protein n=1 Tax=Xanthocytophaga agilis TaxID=3048010 RepID=A0AAE3R9A6_9BACT|nr:hypothetical protein [Xanthocytophaga agilis]MDJ1506069.1 hypothetical protein [Xanthocytophaga agilis]